MIASVFSKSRPFNYILAVVTLVLSFFIYQIQQQNSNPNSNEIMGWLAKLGILLTLIASLFITNFITKRNGLSKDNSYSALFFIAFYYLYPRLFQIVQLLFLPFLYCLP